MIRFLCCHQNTTHIGLRLKCIITSITILKQIILELRENPHDHIKSDELVCILLWQACLIVVLCVYVGILMCVWWCGVVKCVHCNVCTYCDVCVSIVTRVHMSHLDWWRRSPQRRTGAVPGRPQTLAAGCRQRWTGRTGCTPSWNGAYWSCAPGKWCHRVAPCPIAGRERKKKGNSFVLLLLY